MADGGERSQVRTSGLNDKLNARANVDDTYMCMHVVSSTYTHVHV